MFLFARRSAFKLKRINLAKTARGLSSEPEAEDEDRGKVEEGNGVIRARIKRRNIK